MSELPELQPNEPGVAYFWRLVEALKAWTDPTGVVALTKAASVAALALADRNEPVQRAMLQELQAIHCAVDEMKEYLEIIKRRVD